MRAGEELPGTRADAVGAVLAGGAGSRLGGSKAAVELGGLPLIEHPLRAVAEAGLEPLVVAKRSSHLPPLEVPVVIEPDGEPHPLRGIVSALRAAQGRPVVALACDMPFAPAPLLRRLAVAREPLVVPAVGGSLQPLLARYSPSLLTELEAALAACEPLRRTVERLGPRVVEDGELARFGDPARLFFNVNSRADLERAAELLARPGR